jgi:hypothetical protein
MTFRVFDALGATFMFLFRQGLSVLQVVWLPAVLQIIAYFALMPGFMKSTTMLQADPPEDFATGFSRVAPYLAPMLLFTVITLALGIVMSLGLARLAVKGERPKGPFLLRWGDDEWRVLACWGIILACGAGVGIAFAAFNWLAQLLLSSGPIANLLAIVGALAIVLAGVYIAVRLSLFTAATMASQKVGIPVSWDKTEDLFWPLFGFWLLWMVMALILQFVTSGLVTPPEYMQTMQQADIRTPEDFRQAMRDGYAVLAKSYELTSVDNVVRMLIAFLLQLIGSIVFGVASAIAWKQLDDQSEA